MGNRHCHLKLDERRKLAKWLGAKMPVSEIADKLGRDPSTIYRDIKRNRYTDEELPELNGYHALVAQDKYEERRAVQRKMIVHPELKEAIEDRLKVGWSPEQIAGRMRLDGLARQKWRAPTEELGGVLWETETGRRRNFGVKRCDWH